MQSKSVHAGEAGLPTLSKLGIPAELSLSVDPLQIAQQWLDMFAKSVSRSSLDVSSLVSTLLLPSTFQSTFLCPDSDLDPETGLPPVPETADKESSVYWRDALALTWDFRTFEGSKKIETFLRDRLAGANIHNVKLDRTEGPPIVARLFPDMLWVQLLFRFDTDVGGCFGIARLVPVPKQGVDIPSSTEDLEWKAHTVFTRLERLHDVPELLGARRKQDPFHGPWDEARAEEAAFKEREPPVLIVGAGQAGLTVAAHLKVLGVESLMIEKAERVGDNWRKRYEALCLHDPVCECC